MSFPKEKAVQAIIAALGKNKGFSDAKKQDFARDIIGEIEKSLSLGRQAVTQAENFRLLRNRLKSANRAMKNLYEKIKDSELDGAYIDALTCTEVRKRFEVELTPHIFQHYITAFEEVLASQRPVKRKTGPNASSPSAVARMIAVQYHKHFGEYPGYTKSPVKNESKNETLYGKICEAVHDFFNIEISNHTQGVAVEFVKKNNS